MAQHHESFALIAESLRSSFSRLSSKVLEAKKHQPNWTVHDVPTTEFSPQGLMVEEFQELLSLAVLLDRLCFTELTPSQLNGQEGQ